MRSLAGTSPGLSRAEPQVRPRAGLGTNGPRRVHHSPTSHSHTVRNFTGRDLGPEPEMALVLTGPCVCLCAVLPFFLRGLACFRLLQRGPSAMMSCFIDKSVQSSWAPRSGSVPPLRTLTSSTHTVSPRPESWTCVHFRETLETLNPLYSKSILEFLVCSFRGRTCIERPAATRPRSPGLCRGASVMV